MPTRPGVCLSTGVHVWARRSARRRSACSLRRRACGRRMPPRRQALHRPRESVAGQDGFALESANGDYRLQIGVLLHADGRFALDDEARAVRRQLRGAAVPTVSPRPIGAAFRVLPESRLRRRHADRAGRLRRHGVFAGFPGPRRQGEDAVRLRAAAARRRTCCSSSERFPTALAPNRDIGVQVLGDLFGGVVSYLAGVMNGVADGASADVETNDSKDLAGRLVVRPFNRAKAGSAAARTRFRRRGVAGRRSAASCALPVLRTQTLQQPYFSYAIAATPAPSPTAFGPATRRASGTSTRPSAAGPNTSTRDTRPARRHPSTTSTMTPGRLRAPGC